tara:strand:- start:1582 stop:2145 length:564 start_codon:yes stop_codon:yes gene_type:complete
MKIKEHEEMMRYLTRPKVNSDGAFKREVERQKKNGTYGVYNKPENKRKADPTLKHIADVRRDYDGVESKVSYNSATGLFTNPTRDIAFKDAKSAHDWNVSIGKGDPPEETKRIVKKPVYKGMKLWEEKKKTKVEPIKIDIEGISNSLTKYIETMKPTEPVKPQPRYTVERQEGIAGLIDPYKVKKYI